MGYSYGSFRGGPDAKSRGGGDGCGQQGWGSYSWGVPRLIFVSSATGGVFACIVGCHVRHNRAESPSSSAGGWAGGPALPGDSSWWGVSVLSDGSKWWGEPVVGNFFWAWGSAFWAWDARWVSAVRCLVLLLLVGGSVGAAAGHKLQCPSSGCTGCGELH